MKPVQNRIPVIVEEADWPVRLGEIEGDPTSLPRPAQEVVLGLWPVSHVVNSVRNNGPELLDAARPRDRHHAEPD